MTSVVLAITAQKAHPIQYPAQVVNSVPHHKCTTHLAYVMLDITVTLKLLCLIQQMAMLQVRVAGYFMMCLLEDATLPFN